MEFTYKERSGTFVQVAAKKLDVPENELRAFVEEYRDMQVLYRSAIRDVSTRLEILDDEFQFRHKRNPIHTIQTRLKTPRSMMEKLGRRNVAPNIPEIKDKITDIAGIRVICSYMDDIYHLAQVLCAQQGVVLVRTNDYIKTPKPNGYRSLHMVITVPVQFSNAVHRVPVEIQIRTIAMDFWASLEHELRYKSAARITRDIVKELRDCADSIADLDTRMQKVYHQVDEIEENDGAHDE